MRWREGNWPENSLTGPHRCCGKCAGTRRRTDGRTDGRYVASFRNSELNEMK
jgi:hypothetical protein